MLAMSSLIDWIAKRRSARQWKKARRDLLPELEKRLEERPGLVLAKEGVVAAVAALLFEFDPMGVNFEETTDEYDRQARTIVLRASTAFSPLSIEELTDLVYDVFINWLGLDVAGSRDSYVELAADLHGTLGSASSYLVPNNWDGGLYEMEVKFGFSSDRRLLKAVEGLWSRQDLDGPYLSYDLQPDSLTSTTLDLEDLHLLCGVAHIPGWEPVVCASSVDRYDEDGGDYLGLVLPMGALAIADDRVGGYPFKPDDNPPEWTASIDDWLAGIALQLDKLVGIERALFGFEVSGPITENAVDKGEDVVSYVDSSGYHPRPIDDSSQDLRT